MTWKRAVSEIVLDLLDKKEFTAPELREYTSLLESEYPNNNNIESDILGTLQYLRNMGAIAFVDNQGTYKLTKHGRLILLEIIAKDTSR
ncbi:MAG: hypothetical protein OXD54_06780 [Candidatus Poribacteria bacterium]|nr:hypothetical protein [Candidatus Poribacteria bacterium]